MPLIHIKNIYSGWMLQQTPRKYMKPTYTTNDLSGDTRLDGNMMYRRTE
jgi:hypothetical protein